MTLGMLDKMKEMAITASPLVRPISVKEKGGEIGDYYEVVQQGKYLVYLHPWQVTDLRTNTSTGQWLDIEKAVITGDGQKRSGIYSGAIGEYNGLILKSSFDITTGCNSTTGVAVANVRRAVLLGAEAAVIGYGMKNVGGKIIWNEELFDHRRRLEVSGMSIFGIKKARYNATDYGVIVGSTWAQAHT